MRPKVTISGPDQIKSHKGDESANYSFLMLLFVGLLFIQMGCYHYHVTAPKPDPATDYEHRTAHAFLWGLIQSDNVRATDCVSNALDEVHITTNFGYAIVSVATLGIWVPLDVEWRCAKEPSLNGQI